MITTTASHKGFTLVEMAIVLVVIGLLVGMGAGMIGPLTTMSKVRESREVVEADIASVVSWAASNNRLPQWGDGAADTTIDEFVEVAKKTTDAWGRPLIYLYDSNLFNATPTKDTICGRKTTAITLTDGNSGTTIQNIAFVIISQGDDPSIVPPTPPAVIMYTTLDGNAVTPATISGLSTPPNPRNINVPGSTDDIVRLVTLDELRSKIGCQGAQLKIVNNELPYLVSGSDTAAAYNATVTADGGVLSSGYRWCVQNTTGTAITGLTFTPNIFSADCTTLRQTNETNWLSGSSLTITRTPVTPPYQAIAPNSYSFTIYVSDNSDTGTNDNITSKSFVLTVSP